MLRIHFLNVGHGDCTIIEHPSGRLSIIDVNNSQDYDSESFGEVLAEQREKQRAQGLANALQSLGGHPTTGMFGALSNPFSLGGVANPFAPMPNVLTDVTHAMETVKKEVTDPVAFLQKHYSGRRPWRLYFDAS